MRAARVALNARFPDGVPEHWKPSDLWGHVGRSKDTTTRELITWRGMHFWAAVEAQLMRDRHAGRYNPNMGTERHIVSTAEDTRWWQAAQN